MKIKAVFVFCFVYIGAHIYAEIGDPPFLEGPDTEFVEFGELVPNFGQVIKLQENATRNVILAKINYEGEEPKVVFLSTNKDNLQLTIKPSEDKKWDMWVEKVQDYEVEDMRRYDLQVNVKDAKTPVGIVINVGDIDDTKPTLLARQPECNFEENKIGKTNCIYDVSDPEGVTNSIYEILQEDQKEYFNAVFVPEPGITKKGQVVIEVIKALDYEKTSFHKFTLKVTDPNKNDASAEIIMRVTDMPDMLPFWTSIVLSVKVIENKAEKLNVSAQDGDLDVNAEINYKRGNDDYKDYFKINPTTGEIDIFEIDREELDQDIIEFNIVAYEKDNETSQIDATIVVLVEDVNDNRPEIKVISEKKEIPEQTVVANIVQMKISDADTGENAQFTVSLEDNEGNGNNWFEAFEVVPAEGYKEGTFSVNVNVANKDKIDYDKDDKWRTIKLKVVVTEKEGNHRVEHPIEFTLINLNDNQPKFNEESKEDVEILESAEQGQLIKTVLATDDDADDSVIYSLLGSITNILEINEESGEITTKKDNAFDYESQTDIIVQVKAEDNLTDLANTKNSEIITFTIKVQDVNDELPKIQPIESDMAIQENTTAVIDVKIQATDPDQEPNLVFSIDWDKSKATKLGMSVDKQFFKECLEIETSMINGDRRNVEGTFKTGDVSIIDYEKFDVLLLNVVVTDTEQEGINSNAGTVFINIIDINDNAPVFDDVITGELKVKDGADKNTLIGSVLAKDADGPEYNTVTYSIKERKDTKPGLVSITPTRGEIKVETEEIDCDEEKIFKLYYTVIATDCENLEEGEQCYRPEMDIEIEIIDVNDNTPMSCPEAEQEVTIEEEQLVNDIKDVCGSDADRDVDFHTIKYSIDVNDKPELKDKFKVDDKGMISVIQALDREVQAIYTVVVFMEDNQKGLDRKSNRTSFKVILVDINDNYPEFDSPTTFQSKSENTAKGKLVGSVHATDKDETGPFSEVKYTLEKVERIGDIEEDISDCFELKERDDSADIYTAKSTDYKYGDIIFYVKAEDKGDPPQAAEEPTQFTMVLEKYNYKEPTIIKPTEKQIALKYEQEIGKTLVRYNGNKLEPFEIDNEQPETKWDISFEVNDSEFFTIVKKTPRTAELQLIKKVVKEEYTLKVTAKDNSSEPKSDSFEFKLLFIDGKREPVFNVTGQTIMHFEENSTTVEPGLIPEAFLQYQNITEMEIYYFLHDGDSKLFKVEDRNVSVISPLDRETIATHEIKVSVSIINEKPVKPNDESILTIQIEVDDINDNPPNFEQDIYLKGINTDTELNRELFKLTATDDDFMPELTFNMLGVPECKDCNPELEGITEPFSVETDGRVMIMFKVKSTMQGYFKFDVEVTDGLYTAKSSVNIYIVSDVNRVVFRFDDPINKVETKGDKIQKIFSQYLESDCTIDKMDIDVDENQKPINRTKVDTNFIKDNAPVDADIIRAKANQIPVLVQMQAAFQAEDLTLYYVDGWNPEPRNLDRLLSTVLIVVSAVLGTLCIILFAAFVIRTKSLNKRLELLSTTKFGSQSSNLNRINCPAPNTNLYAVEGTNPVYGDDTNIDNHSVGSGDSEFIGIEDNPEFSQSRASFNPVMRDDYRRGSINPITIGAKENNNNNTINENNDDIMF